MKRKYQAEINGSSRIRCWRWQYHLLIANRWESTSSANNGLINALINMQLAIQRSRLLADQKLSGENGSNREQIRLGPMQRNRVIDMPINRE